MRQEPFKFYEFFAGGGMARLGLGKAWHCLFANEWSPRKAESYRSNFAPAAELYVDDIWRLSAADLPARADLAWASFPCQDLSLAGNGAGLDGTRSGTLIKFWSLISELKTEGRPIPFIALENVIGALTSNEGRDFEAMASMAAQAGYRFGAVIIDAARFVPQSRPRLFFIAVAEKLRSAAGFEWNSPPPQWHNQRLCAAVDRLPFKLKQRWIWWNIPCPPRTTRTINDIVEFDNPEVPWHASAETERLLRMMSEVNMAKVRQAKRLGKRVVGTVYKRVRIESGARNQRAEVRFDQISGCLRTPVGGSSRQILLLIEGPSVRSRLITPREAARLMGLPDDYVLPPRYNDAYHLAGDGVVVPVVRFLAEHLLEPLIEGAKTLESEAA